MGRLKIRLLYANIAFWPFVYFVWSLLRFFPNDSGRLGHDYGAYIPWLISGLFWRVTNGVTSIPEFVPAFCAGVPLVFNPQSVYFSLPGLMVSFLSPVLSLAMSWIVFGLVGGLSTYGLLRRIFQVSPEAATVGGVLFMLNGFFFFRMVIGHITFHPFMLVPLMFWSLVRTSRATKLPRSLPTETASRSVLFAALLAYSFYSGGVYVLITVPLMLVALILIAYLMDRCDGHVVTILFWGGCLGVGLCAFRLLPALAYSANVPRPNEMVLSGNLLSIVAGALTTLFIPQILTMFEHKELLYLMRHELEYGVGLAPLLILVATVGRSLLKGTLVQAATGLPVRKVLAVVALIFVLLVPIVFSYSGFGLRWMLTHTPVIKSMSVMIRLWSVYIPILCILTAIALDYLVQNERHRLAWSAGAIALTVIQSASTNVSFYQKQIYDPSGMNVAYRHIRDGQGLPPIDRIERPASPDNFFWNEGFVSGATTLPCYEPIFGYQGESFPLGRLEVGPVMQPSHGLLNLKNPACYVFPGANSCRPGDEFTEAQRSSAEAFTHYKPFPYRWPAWQYAAATLTVVSMVISAVIITATLVGVTRRRKVLRHQA